MRSTCTRRGQATRTFERRLDRTFGHHDRPLKTDALSSLAIEQDPLRVFSYAVWANEVYTRDKAALATVDLDAEDIIYSLSRYYTVFIVLLVGAACDEDLAM